MKRYVLLVLSFILLLGLIACAVVPEDTVPGTTTPEVTAPESTEPEVTEPEATEPEYTEPESDVLEELVYDMNDYDFFGSIFDEKSVEEWNAMGRYTILLKGLSIPVTLEMDGQLVLSVSAYDQTKIVNIGPFQTYIPANFSCTDNAIIVNETLDYCGSTWILTAGGCYEFHPDGSFSTQVFASKDGTMQYCRYWGEYVTTFNQISPLMVCTSRDQFLYETGRAEIVDGEVVLTAEKTVLLSDYFDLDAMFAEAKAEGWFAEYETVDELFEANKAGN